MTSTLRFELLTPTAIAPSRAHETDAGFDLYSDEEVHIRPGARTLVRCGFAMALPEGTAGLVCPRSGLAGKHGITVLNAPGVIDAGYRGEVRVILVNTDSDGNGFTVKPGDRIAQLVITPFLAPTLVEAVVTEDSTDRGQAGFGSTGVSA